MLILVTGASRGIGLELVKKLSATKGSLVMAVSRDTGGLKKISARITNLVPVQADISSDKGIAAVTDSVKNQKAPLGILVNNAGWLVKKEITAMRRDDLQLSFNVNVIAPCLLIRSLLPFVGKEGAHVVNISSMGGVQGSAKFPGMSAYSASKGALGILTECLAEELRSLRVSVNCLALGAVHTEMLQAAFPGYRAPHQAHEMAEYIAQFALTGHHYYNGKLLPVSVSTP